MNGSYNSYKNWEEEGGPIPGIIEIFKYTLSIINFAGTLCVHTSAPNGYFQTAACDDQNYFICEVNENTVFHSEKGTYLFTYYV